MLSFSVSLETQAGGHLDSVSWGLGSHHHGPLVLVISTERVSLFIGCRSLHSHAHPGKNSLLNIFSEKYLELVYILLLFLVLIK